MVLGELCNFRLSGVDLGHGVDGFRWFLGSYAIFLCQGLTWGTLWMVFGGSWGVTQFCFVGGDLGHCVDGFRCFLWSYAISLCRGLTWGTV
jgi:hypothetical protein